MLSLALPAFLLDCWANVVFVGVDIRLVLLAR